MRIHATINERTVRRTFRERKIGRNALTVIDNDLPAFALKVSKNGTKTFIVRVARKLGRDTIVLGKMDEITAQEAREKAVAAIAEARAERETGPLFADFVTDFMRRQGQTLEAVHEEAQCPPDRPIRSLQHTVRARCVLPRLS